MTSVLWHSLLALGAGILLNAAPCVLPVIPFKVQAVLRDIGQSRHQRWGAALALWGGSLAFFLVLGGATILLGLTWGALFQSKIFLTGLTLFLLVAGIFTLLNWSVPLPQWIYQVNGQRYSGAALTGMLTGILATPCGGPFLGAVLAYALTQPPIVGMVIFVSIGTGLVLPYMLLLIWPWLSQRSFKTGPWAEQIKQLLGFVLLGGAVFFAQSLVPDHLQNPLWWGLGVLLLGWALLQLRGPWRWGQCAVPLAVLLTCAGSMAYAAWSPAAPELNWQAYSRAALEQAHAKGQPVMIKFTAEWCLNCQVLKKTTYADPVTVKEVHRANILPLRVDMTELMPEDNRLMFQYGGRVLPYVVLLDPKGDVSQSLSGIFTPATLKKAISDLQNRGGS